MTDAWRERIQIGVIVKRLADHIIGEVDLSPTQVQSARILLGKVAPDLASVTHSGDKDNPIKHVIQGVKLELGSKLDRLAIARPD